MSAEADSVGNHSTPTGHVSIQFVIDKYGEYRHSAVRAALAVFVASALMAAISRSPRWVIRFKDIAGIVPDSTIGVAGGLMPIFGPIAIYVLFLYMYLTMSEALHLRRSIVPRLSSESADAEHILVHPPLMVCDDESPLTQGTSFVWSLIAIYGPVVCYCVLLIDFLYFLEFDGTVISKGYELFYTVHGWSGIWPSGHFGVPGSLPPVYPLWQPILYVLFLLHLCVLATRLMKEAFYGR